VSVRIAVAALSAMLIATRLILFGLSGLFFPLNVPLEKFVTD